MGRAYKKELEELDQSYKWAIKESHASLFRGIKDTMYSPVYIIASGGSLTAAHYAAFAHQKGSQQIAKVVTPMEYCQMDRNPNNVIIISASGNNADIVSALKRATDNKAMHITVLTLTKNNKLTKMAVDHTNVAVSTHDFKMKDGFLATNSLMASIILLWKAYAEWYGNTPGLDSSLNRLAFDGKSISEYMKSIKEKMDIMARRGHILVLHDNIGKIAAMDLESRMHESGLASVQTADYRNFAHGRHNWINKNADSTCILGLVSHQSKKIARETFSLIPPGNVDDGYTPGIEITQNTSEPLKAPIEMLSKTMTFPLFFGQFMGFDPGKPGIPKWGESIYKLKVDF